jgi:hypothetical protein
VKDWEIEGQRFQKERKKKLLTSLGEIERSITKEDMFAKIKLVYYRNQQIK